MYLFDSCIKGQVNIPHLLCWTKNRSANSQKQRQLKYHNSMK